MARATYAELGDACATAHAMELIGGRWSYPILRELMLGPKRFGALLESVRGLTPAVLASRLRELSLSGLICQKDEFDPAALHAYSLTDWALALAPILRELGRWAQSSPVRSAEGGLTPDAAVQAMITMAAGTAPSAPVRLELRLTDDRVAAGGEHTYGIEWSTTAFNGGRGPLADAPAVVHCDSSTWAQVLFAGLPLSESGAVTSGDVATIAVLIDTFRTSTAATAEDSRHARDTRWG